MSDLMDNTPASSGSSFNLQDSAGSSGQDIQELRTRRRTISNRESARRSRMRKQKQLDEMMSKASQLSDGNNQILTSVNIVTRSYENVEAENSVLRAQASELTQRLHSINEIIMTCNNFGGDIMCNIQASAGFDFTSDIMCNSPASPGRSGSSFDLQNSAGSSQQDDIQEERKRRRTISNRESARRSRMRKQKQRDELMSQVSTLSDGNTKILAEIQNVTVSQMNVEAENSVLKAQLSELTHRLQSLNHIVVYSMDFGLGELPADAFQY